jgi:hypothetical protein
LPQSSCHLPCVQALYYGLSHQIDELVGFVVVDGLLLKQLIVEHLSPFQEQGHPSAIEDTPQQEDVKHQFVIEEQHHREHHKDDHGKGDIERLLCEKVIYTAMVANS